MARYRKIDVRIWNDRKFRELDDNAKLAFLLLLTHPDTNQLGFIRSRSVSLAFDLGWQSDAMSNAIQTLCQKGMLMVDERAGLMFLPNFLKYNPPNGVNGAKSWAGLLDLVPECDLRDQALIRLKHLIDRLPEGSREGIPKDIMDAIQDAIRNGNPQPSRIQEQEQEQDINKNLSDERFSSDSPALALDGESDAPKRAPGIPMQKIVETYNARLGSSLGMCRQLNAQRKGNLRQRWRDIAQIVESDKPQDVLQGFSDYYAKVSRSDFLMGRKKDCTFKASFDWIHNSSNFLKIFEGNYENGRKQA